MNEYLYDDFKEQYYKELERKENFNNKVSIIFTIYSLISIPLIYCVNSIQKIEGVNTLSVICYVLFSLSVLFLVWSFYYSIRTFWGHKYKYLPNPQEMDNFLNDTSLYYDEYETSIGIKKEIFIEQRKKEVMYNYYRDFTTNNIKINTLKNQKFNKWTYVTGIAIVFIIISCILLQFIQKKEDLTKVHIDNSIIYTEEVKENE